MKIIKEGDLKRIKKIKTFSCKACGCVVEADKTEYKSNSQYNDTYYYMECPCCHNTMYAGDSYV